MHTAMRSCSSCMHTTPRRLLGDASPSPQSPSSLDSERAHVDRILGLTTTVLFIASMAYLVLSSLYSCLRHRRRRLDDEETSNHHPAPADQDIQYSLERVSEVQEIPVVVYGEEEACGGGQSVGGKDCAVCLAEYVKGDEVRVLPNCRHGFHKECIDRWLLTRAPTCPVCRGTVIVVEDTKHDCSSTNGHNDGGSGVPFAGFRILPVL